MQLIHLVKRTITPVRRRLAQVRVGASTVFDDFTIGLGMVSAEPEQRLENGHRIVAAVVPEGEFMRVNLESFIAHGSVASI